MSPETGPGRARAGLTRAARRARRWLRGNAYLIVAASAAIVLSRTITFEPPELVRIDEHRGEAALLGGEAPVQEFSRTVNPQAVQVQATLRRYTDPELLAGGPDLEADEVGEILSQPVVTTLPEVEARMDQTIRLEGGERVVQLAVAVTPRVSAVGDSRTLLLHYEIRVTAQTKDGWPERMRERVHLDTRGLLAGLEGGAHRVVFSVEDQLFSLDLGLPPG